MQWEIWDPGHQHNAERHPDPEPRPIPPSQGCQVDAPQEGAQGSSTAWTEPMHSGSVPNPPLGPSSRASSHQLPPEPPVPHSQAPFPSTALLQHSWDRESHAVSQTPQGRIQQIPFNVMCIYIHTFTYVNGSDVRDARS